MSSFNLVLQNGWNRKKGWRKFLLPSQATSGIQENGDIILKLEGVEYQYQRNRIWDWFEIDDVKIQECCETF